MVHSGGARHHANNQHKTVGFGDYLGDWTDELTSGTLPRGGVML